MPTEASQADAWLRSRSRLLVIVGAPGSGKTVLIRNMVDDARAAGVSCAYANTANTSDPSHTLQRICDALGIGFTSEARLLAARLDRPTLVAIDDLSPGAEGAVAHLIEAGARVVVAARYGAVPSLGGGRIFIRPLAADAALQVLCAAGASTRDGATLTLREVAQRVGGNPRNLVAAGAALAAVPRWQLEERLTGSFHPETARTLGALSEPMLRALGWLVVFDGVPIGAALGSEDGLERVIALEQLELRGIAVKRGDTYSVDAEVRRAVVSQAEYQRYLPSVTSLLAPFRPILADKTPDEIRCLKRYRSFFIEHHFNSQCRGSERAELALMLFQLLSLEGNHELCEMVLTKALADAPSDHLQPLLAVLAHCQNVQGKVSASRTTAEEAARAKPRDLWGTLWLCRTFLALFRAPEALELVESAALMAREAEDHAASISAKCCLHLVCPWELRTDEMPLLDGGSRWSAWTYANRGYLLAELGRSTEALPYLLRAVSIADSNCDVVFAARCRVYVGYASVCSGASESALGESEAARQQLVAVGDRTFAGLASIVAGLAAHEAGHLGIARQRYASAAAELSGELGPSVLAFLFCAQGLLSLELGLVAEASSALHVAREVFPVELAFEHSLSVSVLAALRATRAENVPECVVPDVRDVLVSWITARAADAATDELRLLRDAQQTGRHVFARLLARACIAHVTAAQENAVPVRNVRVDLTARTVSMDGLIVSLRKRRAGWLIFRCLLERHLASPGATVSASELIEAGWPGERILPHAASSRLYFAVNVLRSEGLRELILSAGNGYLLAPSANIGVTEA